MDLFCKITVLALLLACSSSGAPDDSQLGFLYKLMKRINSEDYVETVLLLQHHQDTKCLLRGWNQPDIGILRVNELLHIDVRKHFNYFTLGLVCICRDSDTSLLDPLASDFTDMRQTRIILLIQIDLTEELLQKVLNKVAEYQFLRMLILEMKDQPKETSSLLRLQLFPHPLFERVDNILNINESIFYAAEFNFKGRTTYIRPNWEAAFKAYTKLPSNDTMPLTRIQDKAVIQFAIKYNASLRVLNSSSKSVTPDIVLRTPTQLNITNIRTVSPYDICSVKVVVPCAREWSIEEAFDRIDVRSWLVHIVLVYVLFIAAETFIIVVTYRISGQAYHLTVLNPMVNLRAFRAILGMSFPISRRGSLSLRQLSVAISIFGLISSNFFSCKLSALLTKHPQHAQVDNFEELQASGLPVIASQTYSRFIESDVGVKLNLTRVEYVSHQDQIQMLLAPNLSNAYFLFSDLWKVYDKYQKSMGSKTMCDSSNLTFIQGLPTMYELKSNSIFAAPLFRYLIRLNEAGIMYPWITYSSFYLRRALNHSIFHTERKDEALSLSHLKWVWCVLGCGHGLALITFLIEVLLGCRKTGSSRPKVTVSVA